jgi:hypothetical protein
MKEYVEEEGKEIEARVCVHCVRWILYNNKEATGVKYESLTAFKEAEPDLAVKTVLTRHTHYLD